MADKSQAVIVMALLVSWKQAHIHKTKIKQALAKAVNKAIKSLLFILICDLLQWLRSHYDFLPCRIQREEIDPFLLVLICLRKIHNFLEHCSLPVNIKDLVLKEPRFE